MLLQDVRKFNYSSDFPTPSMVWKKEIKIPKGTSGTVTIAHGLPFTPLLMGVWSTNSNFNPAYDIANTYGSFDPVNGFSLLNRCDADDTNVYLWVYNSGQAINNDAFFKLFAYAPPDYNGETPSVDDITNFIFNTDYITPKIAKEGFVNLDSSQNTATIWHYLGYVPQARVWGQSAPHPNVSGDNIQPARSSFGINEWGPEIDDQKLIIHMEYSGKYYYHIYGDQANVNSQ